MLLVLLFVIVVIVVGVVVVVVNLQFFLLCLVKRECVTRLVSDHMMIQDALLNHHTCS